MRHCRSFSSKPNLCLDASLARVGTAEGIILLCDLALLLKTEGFWATSGLRVHRPATRACSDRRSTLPAFLWWHWSCGGTLAH